MLTRKMISYIDEDSNVARMLRLLSKNPLGLTQAEIRKELRLSSHSANSAIVVAERSKYCVLTKDKIGGGRYKYRLKEMRCPMSAVIRKGVATPELPMFTPDRTLNLINQVFGV